MRELVVMRLAEMHRGHPAQDNSRVCSRCGERVGIYPSGQSALREYPDMAIVCNVCAKPKSGDEAVPAAPIEDIIQEMRDSYDR